MQLGWIDFSKDERKKVHDVIRLLDEPRSVDELGIGAIRDGFADYFFPGTSTVQTRAKYFLIVPYILKEAGSGKYGNKLKDVLEKIEENEIKCRASFMTEPGQEGVIGGRLGNLWVLRPPSDIYWSGIKKLHIFKEDSLSIKEYISQSILQRANKKAKSYGNRAKDAKDAEDNERDDNDAGDLGFTQFWDADFNCLYNNRESDWIKNLTIDLLPEEALFLKKQIIDNHENSLFAFILKNKINLNKYDALGAFSTKLTTYPPVDENFKHMVDMVNLANSFNDFYSLLTTRYNLIVSQNRNEEALKIWENLTANDIRKKCSVKLEEVFINLDIKNSELKKFLWNTQKEFENSSININKVDTLIVKRESNLRANAKTKKAGTYPTDKWFGPYMLDYRFTPAKRIINDIMKGDKE